MGLAYSKIRLTVPLALPLLWAVAIQAEDWPQWRGPHRDGVWSETGILDSFPPDGLKARWRAPLGPGWSSPVVAKGRVYLTDSELKKPKAKERVHCFDATIGKPLWTYSYEVAYPDWAFSERGPTATPIVQDGKLYTLGNSVIAFDKNTGKEVWKAPSEGLTNSSPIVITAGGTRQLIVWTQGSVTSLNPVTGETYWQEKMKTAAQDAVTTPVFHKNRLLISGLMLQLDAEKPAASILWPDTKAVPRRTLSVTSTALFRGDHLFSARASGRLGVR